MANDILSELQVLVVGGIFLFIGYEILTVQITSGSPVTFVHNIGWAFIIGGIISLAGGAFEIYEHIRK